MHFDEVSVNFLCKCCSPSGLHSELLGNVQKFLCVANGPVLNSRLVRTFKFSSKCILMRRDNLATLVDRRFPLSLPNQTAPVSPPVSCLFLPISLSLSLPVRLYPHCRFYAVDTGSRVSKALRSAGENRDAKLVLITTETFQPFQFNCNVCLR